MSVLGTVKELLDASTSSANRGDGRQESKGAYWCHDCGERILDLDVDADTDPDCPECGDPMEFERSIGSTSCAC